MKEKNISICPITGLHLISHPDWTDVTFTPGYSTTFTIIGTNILFCKTIGSVNLEGLKGVLNLSLQIIRENFENKPFIYMEDISEVTNITVEGRKYYIRFLKGLKKMRALVYYNVSPMLSLSIKLAQKLNLTNFDIFVTKDYSAAVEFALKMLNGKNANKYKGHKINKIKTDPEWSLVFDNFSVRYEVLNGNILHLIPKGTFCLEHIDKLFEFQEKLIEENLIDKLEEYYFVANMKDLEITRECRKLYEKKIQSFFEKYPFKICIYYNANSLANLAFAFHSVFIKFRFKSEKNFDTVMDFVKKDQKLTKKRKKTEKKQNYKTSEETKKYIDEFIDFLGKIDWENYTFNKGFKKEPTHPFYQVYDAITLIRSDLEELYLERKRNDEEKSVLQHKLQQSLKLETMGKLAGSVAHDLNNVLSGIVSYPDIILKELPSIKENDKAVKYIKRMKKSGQKAADIVQDLLTLSRSGVVNFEVLNFNSIIKDYMNSPELKKLRSLKPDIEIECNLDKNLNNISASAIHLSQTIMNLITNAIEAISNAGKVKIITSNKSFKNKQFKGYNKVADGDFVELKISDTGSGISEQDLPKIFEPFYSKKVMGRSGTGLGMLVIKGTVDDHNGFILINSKEEMGSEFLLYFPVKEENVNKKFIQKIDSYTGKGESILIIDDDEDQRIIAYKILKGLYYSVKTIPSGREAIEYLKKETADLIILDMIMEPGIGGLETFRQIRKINPKQKAIIVSGYSLTKHVEEVQKLGAGVYIRKPYTIEDIGIAVFNELNKK